MKKKSSKLVKETGECPVSPPKIEFFLTVVVAHAKTDNNLS